MAGIGTDIDASAVGPFTLSSDARRRGPTRAEPGIVVIITPILSVPWQASVATVDGSSTDFPESGFATHWLSNSGNSTVSGENLQASDTTQVNNPQFSGRYNVVSVHFVMTRHGRLFGFFRSGIPAVGNTLPAGAGLSYSLNDPENARGAAGVSVSGTAAFGNPQPQQP